MLVWLGIEWDGEPVHQSDHQARHVAAVEQLAAAGRAYWCDVHARGRRRPLRGARRAADRLRRLLPRSRPRARRRAGRCGSARRSRARRRGRTSCAARSACRTGTSTTSSSLRSSGAPLFIVANAIDDADMGITHVIRGEDHVSNTPRYILLWQALEFGPLPVVRPPAAAGQRAAQEALQAARRRLRRRLQGARLPRARRCATTSPCSAGGRPTTSRCARSRRSSTCSGSRT